MWIPEDGVADSYKICLSLLEAAKQKGTWKLFDFRYTLSRFNLSLLIYFRNKIFFFCYKIYKIFKINSKLFSVNVEYFLVYEFN